MRLLIVGMPESIHLQRSTTLLEGLGWDVHVVAATSADWYRGFGDVTLHSTRPPGDLGPQPGARMVDHSRRAAELAPLGLAARAVLLAEIIDDVAPDVVHSHQLTIAGAMAALARRHVRRPFPRWVVSNWGSDLQFWARDPEWARVLRSILRDCDAYWCECHRDVGHAWREGFRGTVLPVLPVAGGIDLDEAGRRRAPGPTSARRSIALKGYDHLLGRGLVALDALDACGDLLEGYEVTVYAPSGEHVVQAAHRLTQHGAHVTVLRDVPYDEILAAHGRARTSIGLSVADGTSTAFLEALVGGSFPIQSRSACADEWIDDGTTGLLVDAQDVRAVHDAIRRALTDDDLVDEATPANDAAVRMHLDRREIARRTVAAYEQVLAAPPIGARDVA
ncbi:glycosyltransferase family 4 protein [Actinomarinicola tropica]|uniref:Glycosyltransferase n=1 Tax=Actinomarinicola tropica TaxID=2789776 RepID=A0A5Q2RSZ0_9ACTN|nr:glycosyltransferase family 4 protein [Actinomarinicola tropica]QGG96325.1 glycosyltransferase [Actinomarinicola tropica]